MTSNGTLSLSGFGTLGLNDTFTQADLDAGKVTYAHNDSETTSDSFSFSLADGGEDGSTPASGTFNITIDPVNDAPVNTVPGRQTVAEETPTSILGLSISDVDAGAGSTSTRLVVSGGVLNVTLAGGATMIAPEPMILAT